MAVVHRLFRRELRLLPELIRATPRGDLGRARDLAAHAAFVFGVLHTHHTGEDELLWPKRAERAAPSAELVHTVAAQHEVVDRADRPRGSAGGHLGRGAPARQPPSRS